MRSNVKRGGGGTGSNGKRTSNGSFSEYDEASERENGSSSPGSSGRENEKSPILGSGRHNSGGRTTAKSSDPYEDELKRRWPENYNIISSPFPHDAKGLMEWSWKESVCCSDMEWADFGWRYCFLCASPFLFISFGITLLGKLFHDRYDQGQPLRESETAWERKIRIQGTLQTTGLMIATIFLSFGILLHRYMQFKFEGSFNDMTTVCLRTSVTVIVNVNVILSNLIFLTAMRNRWKQACQLFIVGAYSIALSQLAMACFDTWVLFFTGDYSASDVFFWTLHIGETLYSFFCCILYQTMWGKHLPCVCTNSCVLYVCVCVCVCSLVFSSTFANTSTHTHAHTHTPIHTLTHSRTHTRTLHTLLHTHTLHTHVFTLYTCTRIHPRMYQIITDGKV